MKKIDVLKKAIEKLEGGVHYNWAFSNVCNAGIVAQVALNTDEDGLESYRSEDSRQGYAPRGNWKEMADKLKYCSATGTPLSKVFSTLFECGFSIQDIKNLEDLADLNILSRIKTEGYFSRSDKGSLIKYLKTWVSLLEEQQPRPAMIQPSDKVRRVYVTVDKEIRKLETNLN